MRSRYRINDPEGAHFVTGAIVCWQPIFTTAARCDVLAQALVYSRGIASVARPATSHRLEYPSQLLRYRSPLLLHR